MSMPAVSERALPLAEKPRDLAPGCACAEVCRSLWELEWGSELAEARTKVSGTA